MKAYTRAERQRERLETTIGVMFIVGAIAFSILIIVGQISGAFTPVPAATPTVEPTATVDPARRPLPLTALQFTSEVSYGSTFYVQVYTEPGTRCQIAARVFSLSAGNYQRIPLADYITDASGICEGSFLVTADVSAGEQALAVQLYNGPRAREATWPFTVTP